MSDNLEARIQDIERRLAFFEMQSIGLLRLPDHIRKTVLAVKQLGRATAGDISAITKRARPVESVYLNQLVLRGELQRERVKRSIYFFETHRR